MDDRRLMILYETGADILSHVDQPPKIDLTSSCWQRFSNTNKPTVQTYSVREALEWLGPVMAVVKIRGNAEKTGVGTAVEEIQIVKVIRFTQAMTASLAIRAAVRNIMTGPKHRVNRRLQNIVVRCQSFVKTDKVLNELNQPGHNPIIKYGIHDEYDRVMHRSDATEKQKLRIGVVSEKTEMVDCLVQTMFDPYKGIEFKTPPASSVLIHARLVAAYATEVNGVSDKEYNDAYEREVQHQIDDLTSLISEARSSEVSQEEIC